MDRRQRVIKLDQTQRQELIAIRDTSAKPYLRERASAILKVADGQPAAHVAKCGLLRIRTSKTVYGWLDSFEQFGVNGLYIREGRGRKPAFSPSVSK